MTIPLLQPRRIRRRCAVARGKSGSQNTDQRGETEERTSFDSDRHTHPGMDAALEMMHSFRQACDLQLAALKDASAGHLDVPEAAGTFRNRRLAVVEGGYETTPEFRHLGEGVRLTALVDRKSTRLNSSHLGISYAVFCLKKKNKIAISIDMNQVHHNRAVRDGHDT